MDFGYRMQDNGPKSRHHLDRSIVPRLPIKDANFFFASMGKYGLSLRKAPPGVYPILGFIGIAVGGCAYFCAHTISNPDNVFDRKNNPRPVDSVKQNQTTKFYDPSGRFDSKWTRERL